MVCHHEQPAALEQELAREWLAAVLPDRVPGSIRSGLNVSYAPGSAGSSSVALSAVWPSSGKVAATDRGGPLDASQLKSLPLFADVPDEELAQIAGFAQEVTVDQGRELVREGDFSYEFMAIEEGEAEVTRDGQHVNDLGPGDFFGEMGLLEKTLRNATVTAKTPMKLVTLTGWDLKRMERHIPDAIERVRKTLEERRPD
jgi:CRP/FNR family transcriptional regulator, cyclic AMP receptor protein